MIANYKPNAGGISQQVDELYNHLKAEGKDVAVFSTHGSVLKRIGQFFQLIVLSRKYHVLHVHGCSDWGMLPIVYGVLAAKLWGKRIVATYHGGGVEEFFKRHGRFAKYWLYKADERIVLNGYLKRVFDEYHIPCVVIPNIVTFKVFPKSNKEFIGKRFISLRHLRPIYNIDCILQAFEQTQKKYPDVTLTLLGDGPQRKELEEWTNAHRLQNVRFVGQVENEKVPQYMAEADVLLSAPHIDNMPVSVLEAMNAGLLVVSSRVGGVPYLISENEHGLLFEDNHVDELAIKMIWAIEHREEAQKMIENAQEEVKKYRWENVKDKLFGVYCL